MTRTSDDTTLDAPCMAALLDYVERYGLTPKARLALVETRQPPPEGQTSAARGEMSTTSIDGET